MTSKTALIKMMVYTNLQNVNVGEKSRKLQSAVLRLTSSKLVGSINSNGNEEEI